MHPLEAAQPVYPLFSGKTYEPQQDAARLSGALARVYELMKDGQWRTLRMIAEDAGTSEAGASARLRDLRKPGFQQMYPTQRVDRRRVAGGLYEYRVIVGAKPLPMFDGGMVGPVAREVGT